MMFHGNIVKWWFIRNFTKRPSSQAGSLTANALHFILLMIIQIKCNILCNT